jgi:hypothetical protein
MTASEFERSVLDALTERDRQRRARLLDPANYADADSKFLAKVAQLAGFSEPDGTRKAAARARRARQANEAAAFPDSAA